MCHSRKMAGFSLILRDKVKIPQRVDAAMKNTALIVSLLLSLAGCATYDYDKPSIRQDQCKQEFDEYNRDRQMGIPAGVGGATVSTECMERAP